MREGTTVHSNRQQRFSLVLLFVVFGAARSANAFLAGPHVWATNAGLTMVDPNVKTEFSAF